MDDELSRFCRIVSNAICAGTEHNSCFNYHSAFAVNVAAHVAERTRLMNDLEAEIVPTTTGSSAEFYIEPMLSCLGDYDIMYYYNHELAIPAGYSVPLLPTSVGNSKSLDVYKIHDSGCGIPSYVYLLKNAAETTLAHPVNEYTSRVRQTICLECLSNCVYDELHKVSGPASVRDVVECLNWHGQYFNPYVSSDFVRCMQCPVWPPQAAEWPQRPRFRGWPDSRTVDRVVGQGCDVVPVSHPCHRDDTSQWRLSFSRAEIILLNSWIPLQQTVYHMLRFFVKTESLTSNNKDDSIGDRFNMYHIKTLMLWACELKHLDWWVNDDIIVLCRELLNWLGTCLIEAHCDHYFVQNCNLLHYMNTENRQIEDAVHVLISVTNLQLAAWFFHKYLKKYATYNCPYYIQQLLHGIQTSAQLESAVSAVVEWRTEGFHKRSFAGLSSASSDLSDFLDSRITTRTCKIYNSARATIGPLFGVFVAFVFLKCSGEIRTGGSLNDRMLHVLTTVAGCDFGFVTDVFEKCGTADMGTVEELMAYWYRCVSAESSNISRRMYTELTKAHLHLALRHHDHHADGCVRCLGTIFLASLYYNTGHYQTAIDFCNVITAEGNGQSIAANERRKVQKVDTQLLSECYSDIAAVSGFGSLYDYVKRKAMPVSQRTEYSCSVEVLARFIAVKCRLMGDVEAAKNAKLYEAMQQYRRCVTESPVSIVDVLLFQLVKARCPQFNSRPVFRWIDYLGGNRRLNEVTKGYNPNELCEILIHLAVERLTAYRQFQMDQYGSDCVAATTDFEALNAYRCRQYDRCLSLVRDIVNSVLFMKNMPVICVDSPQLALMDDDVASIVGLMHLVGHRRPSLVKTATQLAIALYLEIQCLLKLKRPVCYLREALLRTQIAYHCHGVSEMSLSHWILAFIYRKAKLHLSTFTDRTL